LSTGALSPDVAEQIIIGLTRACKAAGCVLIAGETAEMPGFYKAGEYDIAGTIVGAVDEEHIIDGRTITPGDRILGLRSNGLHTNGYSLARKIVTEIAGRRYSDQFDPAGHSFGRELLRPHRSYIQALALMERGVIKGCAHITGGGFQENIDRVLPPGCAARIETGAWRPDPIFDFLQQNGNVETDEMYRTFNMGIGMALVAASQEAQSVCAAPELAAFEPREIGRIVEGDQTVTLA
jgi:phosphoribosylformylglycinamidine cyclo-ligase